MTTEHQVLWDRLPPRARKALIWGLWFVTWLGLVGGLFERAFFEFVVLFSALHAVLFLSLFEGRFSAFPVQVRIAYLFWVAAGTYAPYMNILMYITLVGLATNLFLGYCPLARLMYLMPWNREESFTLELLGRVILSPPGEGRFVPVSNLK